MEYFDEVLDRFPLHMLLLLGKYVEKECQTLLRARFFADVQYKLGKEHERQANDLRNGLKDVLSQLINLHILEHAAENVMNFSSRFVLDIFVPKLSYVIDLHGR